MDWKQSCYTLSLIWCYLFNYIRTPILIEDVEECENGIDHCHANASCKNTEGSFLCICNSGYSGNGFVCHGSTYSCIWIYHWVYAYLGFSLDVDECAAEAAHICHANATCTNTNGSFSCRCRSGFSGDGTTCSGRYSWWHAVFTVHIISFFSLFYNVQYFESSA